MVFNLFKLLETNIKIAGLMVFCVVSTYLLVPKLAEIGTHLYGILANYSSHTESNDLTTHQLEIEGQSIYIPPNFGGPDSQHGSGRR